MLSFDDDKIDGIKGERRRESAHENGYQFAIESGYSIRRTS